jgi:hypothetical protein
MARGAAHTASAEMRHRVECANRQTTAGQRRHYEPFMMELLQPIDPDYYRSVQLLIVQVELKELRQWRAAVQRRGTIPVETVERSASLLHFA